MVAELMGDYGGRLAVAVLGVGLALICLIGILWIVRGRRGPSPFVRGGRNRQPRLQVLDAAAVDARRRLVLVRRDDVEHLIMIGGPTDVVIESRIGSSARSAEAPIQETPAAQPASIPAPAAVRPAAEPAIRPAPVLPHAPKAEAVTAPAADIPMRETRAALAPQPTSAASPAPSPMPRIEPAVARIDTVQSQPRMETQVVGQPALDDAARFLDSQRERVFAERSMPPVVPAPAARQISQPTSVSSEKPTALGSDFEKILEEEMANTMAARDASAISRPVRPLPQVAPAAAAPAVTAAGNAKRDEPSLQNEVARIFGEMSASRDK